METKKTLDKEELAELLSSCSDSIIWNGSTDDWIREAEQQNDNAKREENLRESNTEEKPKKEESIFKGRPEIKKEAPVHSAKVISNVTEWSTYFNTPRTEEEIREKCLTDYDNVCFTYMCEKQRIREEFIPELMALSTGLLNKYNYSKYLEPLEHAAMIIAGVEDGEIRKDIFMSVGSHNLKMTMNMLADHLDWPALKRTQHFSKEFQEKYSSILNGKARTQGVLVDEYLKKHKINCKEQNT